jgi:hypothetical protein
MEVDVVMRAKFLISELGTYISRQLGHRVHVAVG